jgi:dTDP-4-dehydrorhamnose 3,5-epimerase
MIFIETSLKNAYVIELEPFEDERGIFSRLFCKQEFKRIGHLKDIVQINHSLTTHAGALRGMHFQRPPHAEIKIIRCIRGKVFDVIIDVRKGSSTFLHWYGETLTPANKRMMYVPEGFAHGFQTLEPDSELLYFHTEYYHPEFEGGIRFDDPKVGIRWPLKITEISERDQNHPLINKSFDGLKMPPSSGL